MKRIHSTLVVFLIFSSTAWAEETEKVRYSSIYNVLAADYLRSTGLNRTNVTISPAIKSKTEGLTPDRIKLEIVASEKTIPIAVQADGSFDLPMAPELLLEDPWIVSDQPVGSLVFSVEGCMVELSPSTGWSWQACPKGMDWTSWVDIKIQDKEVEQIDELKSQ